MRITRPHISNLDGKMNEVNARIERLNETDTSIEDFIPFGISLLTNLEVVFKKASVETKHQLLGSILAEKLVLRGEKYRPPVFKEGFDLIFQSVKQLQDQKNQKRETALLQSPAWYPERDLNPHDPEVNRF